MAQYKSTHATEYISTYSKLIFNIKAFTDSLVIGIRFILPLEVSKKKSGQVIWNNSSSNIRHYGTKNYSP